MNKFVKFITACSLVVTSAVLFSAIIAPTSAQAAGTVTLSQTSNVTVTFLSSSATYNNAFGVFSPTSQLFGYGHNTSAGTTYNLSNVPAGEMVFYINNGVGSTFYSGSTSRNADGVDHALVTNTGTNQWKIAFEDTYGGGDRDYNDIVLQITATPTVIVPPTPVCGTQQVSPASIGLYNSTAVGSTNSAWIPNNYTSGWDVFATGSCSQIQYHTYPYTRTFTLAQKSDVTITGRFAADDTLLSTTVNGYPVSVSGGGYTNWTNFTITIPASETNAGLNTITFVTEDTACVITGFRVEFTGATISNLTQNATKQCVGNAVYNFDSCGNQGTIYQQCTSNQVCQNATCVPVQQPLPTCPTSSPNVAFGKSATSLTGIASYAVDGDTGSAWNAGSYGPASLTINLGQNYSLNQYIIDCGGEHGGNTGTINFFNASGVQVATQAYTCAGAGQPEGVGTPGIISSATGFLNANTPVSSITINGTSNSTNGDWINVHEFSACGSLACTPNTTKQCVGNSVYNFDSCGTQGSLYQQCTANQVCQNAQCVNITCNTDSDCGTNGFIGSPFCQGKGVYQNYKTYTCNNPGTASSSCSNTTAPQLKQTCGINIYSNSTIGSATLRPTLAGYDTTQNYNNPTYNNQTCQNGQCVNITCSTNAQCGTNGVVGSPFCQSGNVYHNYITYTCNNPGTASSSCSNVTTTQLKSTCANGQTCSNGTCINITCSTNAQCGTNGFTGSPFCQGNGVYQNYTTWTCNNPGTVNSTCTNNTVAQLKQTCGTQNNTTTTYTHYWWSTNTNNNYNNNTQTCQNGQCVNITCSTNAQCGTNGVVGSPFCQSGNVYQNYITYTCNNPGTASSSCTNATNAQLVNTCTANQTCTNGSCVNSCIPNVIKKCVGNAIYNFDSCGNQGSYCQTCQNGQTCSNGSCVTNCTPNTTKQCVGNSVYWFDSCGTQGSLYQQCTGNQTCTNGTCVNSCTPNTTKQCVGNAVYNFDSCGNQGTLYQQCTGNQTCTNGTCVNSCTPNTTKQCVGNSVYWFDSCGTQGGLYQQCTGNQTCSNGSCVNSCINHDHQACVGTNVYWFDSCGTQQDIAQNCGFGSCQNGSCIQNSFALSCASNPTQAYAGQSVSFNSFIVLPITASPMMAMNAQIINNAAQPNYNYIWSGACSGTSSVCTTSFSNAGTQTANLTVTVGGVTKTANCSTTIFTSPCNGSSCNH